MHEDDKARDGPVRRIALLRPGGRSALMAATAVAADLRLRGAMVVELSPEWVQDMLDRPSHWGRGAGFYNLIVAMGETTTIANALSSLAQAPVVTIPVDPSYAASDDVWAIALRLSGAAEGPHETSGGDR